jgi:hypothetical protein
VQLDIRNVQEPCPRCGEDAELPDGTFNIIGDTIEVLSASGLTRARLLRLATILEAARVGQISEKAAAQAVVDEAPSLAPLMERYEPNMRRALIVFLFALVQILLAQAVSEFRDDSATRQDVENAVAKAIEYCQTQRP